MDIVRLARRAPWWFSMTRSPSATSRGARTLLTFTSTDRPRLAEALRAIGAAVDAGQIGRLTIDKIDGSPALQADIGDELNAAGFVMVPRGYTRRRRTPGSNRQE